jgi:ATP-dependent Clp protease protease subunit
MEPYYTYYCATHKRCIRSSVHTNKKSNEFISLTHIKKDEIVIIPQRKEIAPAQPLPAPPGPPTPIGVRAHDAGVLMLTGEFKDENITPLIHQIIDINLKPKNEQPDHFTLYVNSPGGAVHSMFHLVDTMKQSKIPVYTIAMGLAASCGFTVLMAGQKGHRYVTQNTMLMSHQYSSGTSGKEHELKSSIKRFDLTTGQFLNHYKKCTGKNENYIRKHLLPEGDVWLTPDEAIKHGCADKVIVTY